MKYNKDNYHELVCLKDLDDLDFHLGFTSEPCRVRLGDKGGTGSWIDHAAGKLNDKIFDDLGIEKTAFCEKYYGYPIPSTAGTWPYSKQGDVEALTRVVIAVFQECDKKAGRSIKIKEEVTNQYQIY